MSAELIGILGVGVALMVGLGGLEQRVARIEGLFEGAGLSRAGGPAEVAGD